MKLILKSVAEIKKSKKTEGWVSLSEDLDLNIYIGGHAVKFTIYQAENELITGTIN